MIRRRLALLVLCGIAAWVPGIQWGLPRQSVNAFLFSSAPPAWSGAQVIRLAGNVNSGGDRPADVSSNALDRSAYAIVVNATEADRARIVRRYRLMSYQPDEFATFAALSQMKPGRGDLDPRMYKYGGLWVYPVGGLLKLASVFDLVRLTPDPAYYLDHPEAFGRFYVVARLYSACWGLVGIVAVFLLVHRICANTSAATCAALCFMLMPVVVTAAHEAKPHLGGMALTLCAVLAGARYVESGFRTTAIVAAVLCGAAVGMVAWALPVLLVIPLMLMFRNSPHAAGRAQRRPGSASEEEESGAALRSARGVGGALNVRVVYGSLVLLFVALAVYCVTNPYVLINLVRDRAVLRSDLGNSSNFYYASISGLPRAMLLSGLGASFLLAAAGAIGAVALGIRAVKLRSATEPQELRRRAAGVLLAAVTLPVGVAFLVFAAGQPADYARFAMPFDVFLCIEAVVAVETLIVRRKWRTACFALLVLTTGLMGAQYLIGFERDCSPSTSRTRLAAFLAKALDRPDAVLASWQEPAPWSLPPVDLFHVRIVLPPRSWPIDRPFAGATVTVAPEDTSEDLSLGQLLFSTPISWANKPFRIQFGPPKVVAR